MRKRSNRRDECLPVLWKPTESHAHLQGSAISKVTVGTKNSGLAAVLSLIIPGVGQMYAGQIGRGLLFLFIGIPLTAIIALLFFWLILPLFLPLAFWIWNIFDAYNLCNEYNRRLIQTGTPPW